MMASMLIQDLPPALRPRDKLLAIGPQSLTDGELLAVLLRTGLPGQSVLMFAQELLHRFEGLAGLLHASPQSASGSQSAMISAAKARVMGRPCARAARSIAETKALTASSERSSLKAA